MRTRRVRARRKRMQVVVEAMVLWPFYARMVLREALSPLTRKQRERGKSLIFSSINLSKYAMICELTG